MKVNVYALAVFCILVLVTVIVTPPTTSEETPPDWTEDIRLTEADGSSSLKARIVTDSQNNLHVVYNDYRHGPPELYYLKVDEEGNILIDEKPITDLDQASSNLGDVGIDSNDNIHIVWSDVRDNGPISNIEIYYEKLDNMGNTLVDERRITYAPYYSLYPSIAIDSSDNLHIAWAEEMEFNVIQEEIFYTKLDNNGNTLVEDTPLTEADGNESLFPDIAVDSRGDAHVVWLDDRNETGTTKCQNYYYTKLNNDGATIVDDTMIFRDGDHFKPSIAVDSSDMIQMICSNRWFSATNEKKHIHYMKLSNIGEPVISAQKLTDTDHNASYPVIDLDSHGDIHVVWEDERNGYTEIYYIKLDDVGNILYDELRLTVNSSKSQQPQIAIDGNNTVNVVWADGRDYGDGDRVELYYKSRLESGVNIPPTVAITSPSEGQTISGSIIIQGTAGDEDGTVSQVEVKIDEDDWIVVTGTTSWVHDWDSNSVDDGLHTIFARSYDGTDYSTEYIVNITVNNGAPIPSNNPPTVTINPIEEDTVSGTVLIQGSSSDSDGVVQNVEIKIDYGGWITATGTNTWSYFWDTTQEEDGNHVIKARAEDDENDHSDIKSISVFVDNGGNSRPQVKIESPIGGNVSGIVVISGTASDPDGDSTITSVQVKIEDEWEDAQGTLDWSYNWDTTTLNDDEYNISARAFDGTDYSDIDSVLVYVDNPHAPNLTITSDIPEKVSGILTIQGIASDVDGEIIKVEIQIDDGPWEEVEGTNDWSYELDTTELSDGEHAITIRVTDDEDEISIEILTIDVENEKNTSLWPIFLVLLILIIFIIIVAILAARRSFLKKGKTELAGELKTSQPVLQSIRCLKCGSLFQADMTSPVISCPHCGASGTT